MTGRIRGPETRLSWLSGLLLVAGILVSRRVEALIVVFEDGRILKADSFELRDERVSISLFGGGTVTVDLDRIERIVEDEVAAPVPLLPEAKPDVSEAAKSVRRISLGTLPPKIPFAEQIMTAAMRHQIDPALIAAVIKAESGFSPFAVSRKGARGLMQLMPATARRLGVRRPFDPGDNIHGGTAYLSFLAERYGDLEPALILAAYNAGEAAVEEYGGIPPYRETQGYVKKVMKLWLEMARAVPPALASNATPLPAGPVHAD